MLCIKMGEEIICTRFENNDMYTIFKRSDQPKELDAAAADYQVATLLAFRNPNRGPLVNAKITDVLIKDSKSYVQIVALLLPPASYLYRAEGGGLSTGLTATAHQFQGLDMDLAKVGGAFKKDWSQPVVDKGASGPSFSK